MIEAGQRAHPGAGGGHRQAVPVAGDRLLAPGALLADQLAHAIVFIQPYCLQGVAHQPGLFLRVAQQRLGGEHEAGAHGLLVIHRAAHRGVGRMEPTVADWRCCASR